jgi:hypothetical protein
LVAVVNTAAHITRIQYRLGIFPRPGVSAERKRRLKMMRALRTVFLSLFAVLVFAFVVTSCGGGGPLAGKWYSNQIVAENDPSGGLYNYWFQSGGKLSYNAGMAEYTYTVTADTLTITVNSDHVETARYSISGNVLTLTKLPDTFPFRGVISDGTYYKKVK